MFFLLILLKINKKEWTDFKLRWDPKKYGGVEVLYVPSMSIWVYTYFFNSRQIIP